MNNRVKAKSAEFWILFFFMIMSLLVCWIVQLFDHINSGIISANASLFLGIIVIYNIIKLYRTRCMEKPELIDIVLFLLFLLGVISTIFAEDVGTAFFGSFGRDEGLYSLCSYYLLFFTASKVESKEERSQLLKLFLGIAAFSCTVGILSGYGVCNGISARWKNVAAIPFGNPNFYGTFSCMAVVTAMGLFLYAREMRMKTGALILYLVAVAAQLCCDSSSPYVGIIMVFLMIFVMELFWTCRKGKNKKLWLQRGRDTGILLLLYVVVVFIINTTRGHSVSNELMYSITSLENGITEDAVFSHRMEIWKIAFRQLPKYWLHGVGVDNFRNIMMDPAIDARCQIYDKAHNEYIQILLTEGVFAVITYIWFLFILFLRGIRNYVKNSQAENHVFMALFFAFFAYIAQAFFNISVVAVAPFFWIFCGLLYERRTPGERVMHLGK